MANNIKTEHASPRQTRSGKREAAQAANEDSSRHANGANGHSNGSSTSEAANAAPSIQALAAACEKIRENYKKRPRTAIQYSHFDKTSAHHAFRGFFVLFWVTLAIMVVTSIPRTMKETGYPFKFKQWPLLTERLIELAFSDFLMVASTGFSLYFHLLYTKTSLLRWGILGMPIQSAFQAAWLSFWVIWPFLRSWSWTAQVFFTLHLLAILMKMHSYAFYTGHLSETERRLVALDQPKGVSRRAAYRYPGRAIRLPQADAHGTEETADELTRLREGLALELVSEPGNVTYPQNMNVSNYVDYLFCPTLCYKIEYPRTPEFDPMELFYKTLAVFGCIFLATLTSEEMVIPVLDESAIRMQTENSLSEVGIIMAEAISRLLFPFVILFLLVFFIIFEYVLGAFSEITRFEDRQFYSDWWNSCDWMEFSREWNIPVHHFLRRHVYSTSLSYTSKGGAQALTFFVSALAHELVMICITRKLRGYAFFMMILQIPIAVVQTSKLFAGRTLLNNVLFWCSMILGLSMNCALYVLC